MLHAVDRCAAPGAAAPSPRPARGGFRIGLVALAAALALAGCHDDSAGKAASAPADPAAASPAPAAQPAVVQAAYTPPSAEVLYQMVAPIALYPDKLVAQILAGSTYPDQVSAAEAWLAQNPGLKAAALSDAANTQPWDPSIKSLTLFPNVLGQMASNLPWTTALGKAYYNDPADVMNAIQVMRGRAYKAGSLKDSSHLKVKLVSDAQPVESYTPSDATPALPVSAPVIAPPPQFFEIAPSEPSTVYVPQYNPAVVYGDPMPVYGGYSYITAPPPPVLAGGIATPVVAGLIGFGVGVAVTQVIDHPRPWGWDSWRMHWGEPGRPGYWRQGERPPPPLARPAVVYNHQTYVSNSTTVVENIHNINNVRVNNHGADAGRPAQALAEPPGHGPAINAAAAAAAAAGVVAGSALAQRHPPQPAAAPPMQAAPGAQPPRGLSMAQQLQRQQPSAMPPDQARQQHLMQQQARDQGRQQQMAQQHAQQDQIRQQQMAQQRAQQEQMRQQQMAQQRAQQEQMHQQQMAQQHAQQDQMHQQQMAQQRAQQDQMHQQQMAQQRAQQEQMHQQQMAQQRAQQEQMRQQQMAQQRAQQEQMHQQQMAQQHAQQQAMQQAQQQQMRQQQMNQQAHQQQAFHQQPREGRRGDRHER